jgi:NnrS protein
MTLAIMTRASLGHTGHALRARPPTVLIYACVVAGATLRVATPALPILTAAARLWERRVRAVRRRLRTDADALDARTPWLNPHRKAASHGRA